MSGESNARCRAAIKDTRPVLAKVNRDWWPNQLNLHVLHQNSPLPSPMGKAFKLCQGIRKPGPGGRNQGPPCVDDAVAGLVAGRLWPLRAVLHSDGVAQRRHLRIGDGRGGASSGTQRFAPLNSWPTMSASTRPPVALADQAEIRPKNLMGRPYGSHRELRPRVDGIQDLRFRRRPARTSGSQKTTLTGALHTWLGDERYSGDRQLKNPLAAVQMGLIYVNPEGPNGKPDPAAAATDIRETFARMAMNDEETIAVIAGGQRSANATALPIPANMSVPNPRAAPIEQQGLGWRAPSAAAKASTRSAAGWRAPGPPTRCSGTPTYLDNIFRYEWELTKSPAGAYQWTPKDASAADTVPDAHDPAKAARPDDAHDGPRAQD